MNNGRNPGGAIIAACYRRPAVLRTLLTVFSDKGRKKEEVREAACPCSEPDDREAERWRRQAPGR